MTDIRDVATTGLEVAVQLNQRPGNPAITPEGRMILSLHPFSYHEESPYRMVEVLDDESTRPFPDEDWSTEPDEDGGGLPKRRGGSLQDAIRGLAFPATGTRRCRSLRWAGAW